MKKSANNVGSNLIDQIQLMIGHPHQIVMRRERRWASITFSGTRHIIEITSTTRASPAFAASLEERLANHDFALLGHFVADFVVHPGEPKTQSLTLEILTIVDPLT